MLSLPLPPEHVKLTVNLLPGFFTGMPSPSVAQAISLDLLVTDSVKRLRSLLAHQLDETPDHFLLVTLSRGTVSLREFHQQVRILDDASPLPQTAEWLLAYQVTAGVSSHLVVA